MKQRSPVSASPEMWEFVPLERYVIPGDTQKNWVRKKRRSLGRLFGPRRDEAPSRVRAENELRAVAGIRLEHWVPPIDWAPAAHAPDRAQFDKPIAVIAREQPWGTHYRIRAYPVDPRQQSRFVSDLTVRGKAALCRLPVRFSTVPATTENAHSLPS